MSVREFLNGKVKRLSFFDIKLIQLMTVFLTLIVVKLVPQMTGISLWWLITFAVLLSLRPVYVFFKR